MRRSAILFTFILGCLSGQSLPTAYSIATLAGKLDLGDNGPAARAIIRFPSAVTMDRNGNTYVAETIGRVRKITPAGVISTFAGNGVPRTSGDGKLATEAEIGRPTGLAVDSTGNVFILDSRTCQIRKVSNDGRISTVAGKDFCDSTPNGSLAAGSNIEAFDIAIDRQNRVVFSEPFAGLVRRIETNGTLTTIAGVDRCCFSGDGGPATSAALDWPQSLAYDATGNLYIGDYFGCRVRQVNPTGIINTVAGNGLCTTTGDGASATASAIGFVTAVSADAAGNLYIGDLGNYRVRQVGLSNNSLTTIAGFFGAGFAGDGGPAIRGAFSNIVDLFWDPRGLLIADQNNHRLRRILGDNVDTAAGREPFAGDGGPAADAVLFTPYDVSVDAAGNVLVLDADNNRLRQINSAGAIQTVAGAASLGAFNGDDKPALEMQLAGPHAVFVAPTGITYFTDERNGRVLAMNRTTGRITTVIKRLSSPAGVVLSPTGTTLYVAEQGKHQIVAIELATGNSSIYAGTGTLGYSGDGGQANRAQLRSPEMIAVDPSGNLYIADWGNDRIRKVTPGRVISTIAGNGTRASTGDGGLATAASVEDPLGIALDERGNVYFSEILRIRRIDVSTGRIATIAGNGEGGFSGDGGLAINARLRHPNGLRVLRNGTVYFTDGLNDRVRTLTPIGAAALQIARGNTQSTAPGTLFGEPLGVRAVSSAGIAIPGVELQFEIVAGAATLGARTVATGPDGIALTSVTAGPTAGPVTVRVSGAGLPALTFALTVAIGAVPPPPPVTTNNPRIASGGIVQAGNFGGGNTISPGTWIEIYGTNFSPREATWAGAFNGTQAPDTLDGVRVLIDGKRAFLQLVHPGQINALVPDGIGTGPVRVQITNAIGNSEEVVVTGAARSPGLLAPAAFNVGSRQYAAAFHTDGSFVGRADLIAGVAFRPALPGDRIVLYGIGFGPTNPLVPPGTITGAANSLPNFVVKLGDTVVVAEYAGLAGSFVGLYQFNLVIPEGLSGDQRLTVTANGAAVVQQLFLTLQ